MILFNQLALILISINILLKQPIPIIIFPPFHVIERIYDTHLYRVVDEMYDINQPTSPTINFYKPFYTDNPSQTFPPSSTAASCPSA